jgi:hypothetical protein
MVTGLGFGFEQQHRSVRSDLGREACASHAGADDRHVRGADHA